MCISVGNMHLKRFLVNQLTPLVKGPFKSNIGYCRFKYSVFASSTCSSTDVINVSEQINNEEAASAAAGTVEDILRRVANERSRYGFKRNPTTKRETVIVEYSSPNIAKPFHAGHLRSTIIGNFVANINHSFGHKVVRINYLGDWGTQFGLLGFGFEKYGSDDKLSEEGLKHLYEVYVKINKDSETDKSVHERGMEYFNKLENGDVKSTALWKQFCDCTKAEYSIIYRRLGIHFDVYNFESEYSERAKDVVQMMRDTGLLEFHGNEKLGYVDLSTDDEPGLYANLIKSDGSTLYLTRDVAAAIDRYKKYKFDRIHYVVDQNQVQHFKQLVYLLRKAGYAWLSQPIENVHIKFGKILGMNTRKGQVTFLADILDEAKSRMIKRLHQAKTTKITEDIYEETADVLGISGIIIQDLKDRKTRDYRFNWDQILSMKGDSGVTLQYAHARLCSLEMYSGVSLTLTPDVDLLTEITAHQLIEHIGRFENVINKAFLKYEPHIIVQYLFKLVHRINAANKTLKVKGQDPKLAEQRLYLFHCARITLANGLRLLGLKPLVQL